MDVLSRGRETSQKLIYNVQWVIRKVNWANESETNNSGFDSGVSATNQNTIQVFFSRSYYTCDIQKNISHLCLFYVLCFLIMKCGICAQQKIEFFENVA